MVTFAAIQKPASEFSVNFHTSHNANSLWHAGEVAADQKRWSEAERAYREALALEPGHVPSLIGLSTMLSRRGAHREAHATTLAAKAQQPAHPALLFALAQRLRHFHEYRLLEECLAPPAFAAQAPVTALAQAVVMLSSIGAHQSAVQMAETALRREPGHAAMLYVRGNLHQFDGGMEAAEQCYEAAIAADPRLFQASWMLAAARTQTPQSNHVERLKSQLEQATPGGQGEAYVAFGLHKELHDLGDYEGAWAALARGCAVKRQLSNYSLADDAALVDGLVDLCTPGFLQTTSDIEQPAVPIFIIGMHRSGTSLLERMLAGHTLVGDAGETGVFGAQMQLAADHRVPDRIDAELVRRASAIDYDQVARGYARQAQWLSRGNAMFTEKLPSNFWNLGFIAKALPQARIVHLVRDPMDTCFSNLRTLFSEAATYSYVQEELAGFYLQYRRLMRHWHAVLPGRVLDVSYDDLVQHPEATAARIAAHCGLDYQSGLVDVARSGGSMATASAALARQGIRRDRGHVWRHYQRYLEPMAQTLRPAYAGLGVEPA